LRKSLPKRGEETKKPTASFSGSGDFYNLHKTTIKSEIGEKKPKRRQRNPERLLSETGSLLSSREVGQNIPYLGKPKTHTLEEGTPQKK